MNYTIVPIAEKYFNGFWATLDSVARERQYLAFLEGPSLEKFHSFVLESIKKASPHFLALVNDKVVGWCDITQADRPIHAHCGVLGMGVVKEYRGQGIGKALIQTTLEKAQSSGLTRVELTVREGNTRALDLYKKFGFCVEGIKRNGVRIDGAYEDLICMGLLLKE
ncbi:MAG: GNAT family N-acetyltransferase [Candidatus Paracaedibacter sp.]